MRRYWLILPLAFLLFGVGPVYAQGEPEWRSWPLGQRFGVDLGAFFANLETTVRLDGTNGILGTSISFEQDLGLDDSKIRPMVAAHWRFFKKHRLDVSYFNLDRSGDSSTTVNIRFGDFNFQANLPLQAFLDIEVFNLGYSYSVLFDEKKELAFGLALSFQDLAVGMQGTVQGQPLEVSEGESFLAPLPTFTGRFNYAFTPKWILNVSLGFFTIETDLGETQLDGTIVAAMTSIKWQLFKHFNVGLGYNVFDVDVETENERRITDIDYQYNGPTLFMGASF